MEMQEYIPVDFFCTQHGVDISFINGLQDFGLLEIIKVNETDCIPINQLAEAERLVRLYGDLEINLEGIDVVINLLSRINEMRTEVQLLRTRLCLYETDDK